MEILLGHRVLAVASAGTRTGSIFRSDTERTEEKLCVLHASVAKNCWPIYADLY